MCVPIVTPTDVSYEQFSFTPDDVTVADETYIQYSGILLFYYL